MSYLRYMIETLNNETMKATTKDEIINRVWDKIDSDYATAVIANDFEYIKILEAVKEDLFNTLND